jgi:CheY-like chemotaxis protein
MQHQNNAMAQERLKVLIVEDDAINARLATIVLEDEGFEVTHVSNGKEGLENMLSGQFNVALIDINLGAGSIDGVELIKRYKAAAVEYHIPAIALTAFAMVGDKERFLAAGFDAYLSKPIDIDDLVQMVEEIHQNRTR